MKTKRIITLLLALIMSIQLLGIAGLTLNADPADGTLSVDVAYENNPGFAAMSVTFAFDSTVLTLTGATNCLSGVVMTPSKALASPFTCIFDTASVCSESGVFVTLTFTVSATAAKGSFSTISVTCDSMCDDNLDLRYPSLKNGDVLIPDDLLSTNGSMFASYISSRSNTAVLNSHDLRFVLVVDNELARNLSSATVTLSFTGSVNKSFSGKLSNSPDSDYKLYTTVSADDKIYTAAEGYAVFGVIISGVPDTDWNNVQITITNDSDASLLHAGTASNASVLSGVKVENKSPSVELPPDYFD